MFAKILLGLLALSPILNAEESAENTLNLPPTTVHGYITTDYQGGVLINDASQKNKIVPSFEQYRFVFGFASQLAENWFFNSEVEFEHATRVGVKTSTSGGNVTSASAGLEIEIEQAYIENRRWEAFKPRFGVVLPPIGRLNINHDADTVASVDRPISDQQIMPTTWFEPGLGASGLLDFGAISLGYEAYAINGLRGTTQTAGDESKLRDLRMHKDAANDNNTDKALVGRLALGLGSSAEVAVSGYRGSYDPTGSLYYTYGAVDGIVKWRFLELQGEWLSLHTEKPVGAAQTFAGLRQGWYAQLLASLPYADWGTFQPYIQVSQIDPNVSELTALDQTRTTYGLNYRPAEKIVFKLAYADTQYAKSYVNAGGGLSAVLDQRLMAAAAWGF